MTRYADVKDVMSGKYPIQQNAYRFGELAEGTIGRLPLEQHDVFFKVLDFESHFLSRKDGDEHLRLRRIAARAFSARRIEMLRESVQRHTDDLIEEMLGGRTTTSSATSPTGCPCASSSTSSACRSRTVT